MVLIVGGTTSTRSRRAPTRSISALEAAIQLADQAQFATLQGFLLGVQGRKGEARSALNRAVALYPGYQPAIRLLARLGN
jgi:predicted RNA polymerase sigma factor